RRRGSARRVRRRTQIGGRRLARADDRRPRGAPRMDLARALRAPREPPLLCEQRPTLVIAPTSANLQKAADRALELKAQALDEPDRPDIRRLDARLEAVQL